MARYKMIRQEDLQYRLAQKRMKISETVDVTYVCLLLLSVAVCGFYQTNSLVVGGGLLFMGAISIAATLFHICTARKGWKPVFWYDDPQNQKYVTQEMREKSLAEMNLIQRLKLIFLSLFSVVLPILGILKLLEII